MNIYNTYDTVAGLDEAGRGSLAGPLVGSMVVLSLRNLQKIKRYGNIIRDSKTMTPLQRKYVFSLIRYFKIPFFAEFISHRIINSRGIGYANKLVFRKLIRQAAADVYLIDGIINPFKKSTDRQIIVMPHADSREIPVQLAGIIAKVIRDEYMIRLSKLFPEYGFEKHKGYGTNDHIQAIFKSGPTKVHRVLFIKTALINFGKKGVKSVSTYL